MTISPTGQYKRNCIQLPYGLTWCIREVRWRPCVIYILQNPAQMRSVAKSGETGDQEIKRGVAKSQLKSIKLGKQKQSLCLSKAKAFDFRC